MLSLLVPKPVLPAGRLTLKPKKALLADPLPYTAIPVPGSGSMFRALQLTAAPALDLQLLAARCRRPLRGLLMTKGSSCPVETTERM